MIRAFTAVVACSLAALGPFIVPVSGARHVAHRSSFNWAQRDTAVYVVSTLNLVRTPNGRSLPSTLGAQFGITRFDVNADLKSRQLYFIELERSDETIFGALAYQIGWFKPMSVAPWLERLGVRKVPRSIVAAYKSDQKQQIGSFSTTLPE